MKKSLLASALTCTTALFLLSAPYHANANDMQSAHWGYEGAEGPEHWGELKEDFGTCATGHTQSPINITATAHEDLPDIHLEYKDGPLSIVNNGHTVQVNVPEGSNMTIDGTVYHLLQFHFHTPSENKIEGKQYPMEMHLVHKTDDGKLGVLAVMIEEGSENPVYDKFWSKMPEHAGEPEELANVTLNPLDLLPEDKHYYHFMGSLTTPPCSEGVNWHVLETPIQLSKEQIEHFQKLFPMNARPVQPANDRAVVMDE